jgi:hypothetical protein
MITGGYTLDLYCRNGSVHEKETCKAPQTFKWAQSFSQYTGETYGEAKRQAQEDGWRFHRDGEVSCPWCAKRATTPPA